MSNGSGNGILISVIMPIYNVKQYLHKSINSILNQSEKNIELILVDDGSTDGSRQIIEEYTKKDNRVTGIFQQNSGTGPARNCGLENAKGKYIYFMDPDDWLEGEMFFENGLLLARNQPDILIFGYYDHIYNEIRTQDLEDQYIENRSEFLSEFNALFNKGIMYTLWNKLYRRDFLAENELTFGTEKNGQDYVFNLSVYDKVNSVTVSSQKYYHYVVKRIGSATNKFHPDVYLYYKQEQLKLIEFLRKNDIYSEQIVSDRWYFILNNSWKRSRQVNDIKQANKFIDDIINEYISNSYMKPFRLTHIKWTIKYLFFYRYRMFKLSRLK